MKISKKVKILEQEIMDLKIKQHKEKYIHIPFSWKHIGLFFLSLFGIGLSIANFMLIITIGNIFKVWELLSATPETIKTTYSGFEQLIIVYPLIGEYCLILGTILIIVAMFKGGFDKLDFDFWGLIGGLTWGLIGGLIGGLILGLTWGLIGGLTWGLIGGLIGGLILGLIFGFDN